MSRLIILKESNNYFIIENTDVEATQGITKFTVVKWKEKIVAFLFVLFYTTTLIGAGHNKHYCHGELVKTSWFIFSHEDCCCSDEEDMGCCDNETDFFRIKDDHVNQNPSAEIGNPLVKLLKKIESPDIFSAPSRFAFYQINYYSDLPPPDFREQTLSKSTLFITHCNFRL